LAAVTLLLGCAAWIGLLLFYDTLFEDYVFFSDLRIDKRSRVTKAFLFLVGPWVAFISSLIGIGMASRGGDEDRLELISLCSTVFCAPALLAGALAFFHVWDWNWLAWGAVYVGVMTTLFGIESGKALLEYSISNPLRGLRFERPTDVAV